MCDPANWKITERFTLDQLPPEVKLCIVERLDIYSQGLLAQTSWEYFELIEKYQINLFPYTSLADGICKQVKKVTDWVDTLSGDPQRLVNKKELHLVGHLARNDERIDPLLNLDTPTHSPRELQFKMMIIFKRCGWRSRCWHFADIKIAEIRITYLEPNLELREKASIEHAIHLVRKRIESGSANWLYASLR